LADKISNLLSMAESPPAHWSVQRRLDYIAWARQVVAGLRADAHPELQTKFRGSNSRGGSDRRTVSTVSGWVHKDLGIVLVIDTTDGLCRLVKTSRGGAWRRYRVTSDANFAVAAGRVEDIHRPWENALLRSALNCSFG
jgi:hypothetical protein